jgi:hypothetical protein
MKCGCGCNPRRTGCTGVGECFVERKIDGVWKKMTVCWDCQLATDRQYYPKPHTPAPTQKARFFDLKRKRKTS